MKTNKEIAEELKDKYSYYVGDNLSDFEMVSGRSVILPNDIVPMITEAMQTYADQFKNEWVSVEDRLPEIGKPVLLYNEDYGIAVGNLHFRGEWNYAGGQLRARGFVTHWQPLPSPPKTTEI